MKLKRKIYKKLLEWKNEYESYLLIDFAKKKDKEVEVYFERYLNDLDTFFLLLQTHFGKKLTDRKSLIIFDEVQMFPQAIAQMLVANGHRLYFYTHYNENKHRNDMEIDFIISNNSRLKYKVFPIEVKSGKLYYSSRKFDCERWNYLYSPIYDDEYIEI